VRKLGLLLRGVDAVAAFANPPASELRARWMLAQASCGLRHMWSFRRE